MKYKLIIILLVTYSLIANSFQASAQTSAEFLVSWQAKNYTPSEFKGKALPSRGSQVNASFELIQDGKLVNLSKTEVRWFLNKKLEKSGLGLKTISFFIPRAATGGQFLKISLPAYKGAKLEQSVFIPLAEPEIVIDAPYPDGRITAGNNIFTLLPYFFNNIITPQQLSVRWEANNLPAVAESESPHVLNLDASLGKSGEQIRLTVAAVNSLDDLEFANTTLKLEIQWRVLAKNYYC